MQLRADGKTMIYTEQSAIKASEIFLRNRAAAAVVPMARLNNGILMRTS